MTQTATPDVLASLLREIAAQNADALQTLYRAVSPKLFGVALRILHRREWAEEVLQDAFLNIWRFASDYREERAAPMTWMATIVRNRSLDHLRRSGNADGELDENFDEWMAAPGMGVAEQFELSEQAALLANCMSLLDPSQRQAIALGYLRDQSHSEIAATLGAPLGTVKSWIRRGLEKLKSCLGDEQR